MKIKKHMIVNRAAIDNSKLFRNGAYSIKIAQTIDEIESMRDVWNNLQFHNSTDIDFHPTCNIDFYLNRVTSKPEIVQPHVVLLSHNSYPKAMIIGYIEKNPLYLKIGNINVLRINTCVLMVVLGGFLGEQSYDTTQILISKLIDNLHRGEADMVQLSALRVDSELYKLAKQKSNSFSRDYVSQESIQWRTSLTCTYDEFFMSLSKKTRYKLRKWSEKIKKDFGNAIEVKYFRDLGDFELFMKDTEKIAEKTYQRHLGVGFIDNKETRMWILHAIKEKRFLGVVLYIKGEPCAFCCGVKYRKTYFGINTGYDPAFKEYAIGYFVHMKVIEELCLDNNVEVYDFGFGDAENKRKLCHQKCVRSHVRIFSTTLKGMTINAIITLNSIIDNAIRWTLKHSNLLNQIKKRIKIYVYEKRSKSSLL